MVAYSHSDVSNPNRSMNGWPKMIACSSARVSNIVGNTRVMQAASEQGKSQVTRRRVISYSKRERHLNVMTIFTSRPVCFTLDFQQNPRSNELKKTKFGWLFKEGLNLGSVNCEWRSCCFFWMRMLALFFSFLTSVSRRWHVLSMILSREIQRLMPSLH